MPSGTESRQLARRVFVAFLFTFLAARVLVYLIVARRIPDLYLRVGGTHVHHLNYGIFLLSAVGAYLLFRCPQGGALLKAGTLYGVALALTFDEFGLWVHLGGSYWQAASFDAVVVILALLGLILVAPLRRFRPHDWVTAVALSLALVVFGITLVESLKYADRLLIRIQVIEKSQPPLR